MVDIAENNKSSKSNQSVEKVFNIIELLAEKGEPMRILDISKELCMNTSTVLRFLATLESCGYVSQDEETLKYYLTYKICNVANKVSSKDSIREIARPYMKQLSKIFGESVCLAVEQEMTVVYIDVVEGQDQMLRTMQRIGNIAPMHCTGIGKLFLLDYPESKLDKLIDIKGLQRFTEYTLTSKEQIVDQLKEIGELGYAYDNEECEVGARCIAFPIRDYTGKIVAGISVTGPVSRLTDTHISNRMKYILDISNEISKKLGYEA